MKSQTISMLKTYVHKDGVDSGDWDKVSPHLLTIADYLMSHCDTYGLPIVFTSIIRPGIKGISVSKTHSEGRAFDISVRGWSTEDITFLVGVINEHLSIGAISFSDGSEREVIFEPSIVRGGKVVKTEHLHFQCKR